MTTPSRRRGIPRQGTPHARRSTNVATEAEPRQLTRDDQHLVEDLLKALRDPSDDGHALRMDLLQALVVAALDRGDKVSARRHVMKRIELQRARAAGQGG